MQEFHIIFYRKENSFCPIEEFLNSLSIKMRTKALRMIALLEQHGNELREPYSKSLDNGIFELRIQQGSNTARILYFFMVDNQIVLINGFIKKTQKTPAQEITKAKRYRNDYIRRFK
ncbi:MAG: type II toxin-antitoxin system RelE/ParE family toxin [Clostridiales bacterium]|nr:type II toxin-antitoxin system RelE/ParE family toxin [Clostridiales bacterium]